MAAAHGIDLNGITPTGEAKRITKADVEAQLTRSSMWRGDSKVSASPAARRLAREKQVELKVIRGSGPQGLIQVGDVLAFIDRQKQIDLPLESQAAAPEVIPLIGMRRSIAERMMASYQNIPHIKFTACADMTRFDKVRTRLNALAEKRGEEKITATAFFCQAGSKYALSSPILE
jgi:pyruvate dehydrogenase E2 component (dihydrolipoamide acetyltransferase)